ncbi:MAG: hypothetical protein HN348_17170, partial [Proteobacteria bacterium]|nr:hypothetical protein [Pseudomonadota bacterium]
MVLPDYGIIDLMKESAIKIASTVAGFMLPMVIAVPLFLFFSQGSMIFPVPTVSQEQISESARRDHVEELHLVASDGTPLYGRHGKARGERGVIFFHGNGGSVAYSGVLNAFYIERGWDFIVVEYRGYPGSGGTPSEEGIALDALAAWNYATDTLGIPSSHLILYGQSLGGGVASRLASVVSPGGLLVEASFTSLADVAAQRYPVPFARKFVKHPFNTRKYAATVTCPTLILHGTADTVIPVSHGQQLATMFADATYVEAPD